MFCVCVCCFVLCVEFLCCISVWYFCRIVVRICCARCMHGSFTLYFCEIWLSGTSVYVCVCVWGIFVLYYCVVLLCGVYM